MSEWNTLSEEAVDEVHPVLSEESYLSLLREIALQKKAMPQASGLGMANIHTIPDDLEQSRRKVRIVMDRMTRLRRLCFLYEVGEREARRKAERLKRENAELLRQKEELERELLRLNNQVKTLLGIRRKAKHDGEGTEQSDGASEQGDADSATGKRRRGAPRGHRGATPQCH